MEPIADLAGSNVRAFSTLNAFDNGGFDFGMQAMASTSHMAINASQIGELASPMSLGSAPNALLDATDFGGITQMPSLSNGLAVASGQSLVAAAAGIEVQHNAVVEQIVADALHGGGNGPDINALLNALPGAGLGAEAGLHGLATPVMEGVSNGDMGHAGVFTFDVASIITSEAMVLHHDAVQPVANG
jgi:hypothetical protein